MFDNFLYLIIVLLIYSTYQPPDAPRLHFETAFFGAAIFAFFFRMMIRKRLRRFVREETAVPHAYLDRRFDASVRQLSISAIVLFAVDLYGFELPAYFVNLPFLNRAPTLVAFLFLGIFVAYMAMIWSEAYEAQESVHLRGGSKKTYIVSNISMAVPVLMPWLVLSATVDFINLLPFDAPKRFMASSEGETFFFISFLFFITLLGPFFIQRLWHCRPLEVGYWRDRIKELGQRAGCRFADIVYWPIFGGRMITAGVMGLVRKFRYLLVTEALFSYLTPDEVDAVIAHEIGHVKKRHMLFYLLFFGGYLLFYYSVFEILLSFIFITPAFRWLIQTSGISLATATEVVVLIMAIFLFFLYFRYIFGYFMRNFERQADAYVYTLFQSAAPLISTFEKIAYTSAEGPDKPSWHHFSITERIDYLEKCEADRRYVRRQDRKVTFSISAFVVVLLCVGVTGYQLNFGGMGKRLSGHFLEKMILGQMAENKADAGAIKALADLYLDRKDYENAVTYYYRALKLEPANANTLNNLAWLYATAEDPAYRKPDKALSLAISAARIEPAPYILDTLAECYYLNKDFEEAFEASSRALSAATEEKTYFSKRLEKFEKAYQLHGTTERIDI
jgi:Zn-dependent protease with chaperone function